MVSKTSRGIVLAGLGLGILQFLVYCAVSRNMERKIDVPAWWNPSIELWLYGWTPARYGTRIDDVRLPSRIHRAVGPGDRVTVTCHDFPDFFSEESPVLVTTRIEGPRGSSVFFSTDHPVWATGWMASLLLPLLVSLIIAIELEARRK